MTDYSPMSLQVAEMSSVSEKIGGSKKTAPSSCANTNWGLTNHLVEVGDRLMPQPTQNRRQITLGGV